MAVPMPEPNHPSNQALISLAEAAKLPELQVNGRAPCIRTLFRYCTRGRSGGIRLRTVVVGRHRATCRKWVREFVQAVTDYRNRQCDTFGAAAPDEEYATR